MPLAKIRVRFKPFWVAPLTLLTELLGLLIYLRHRSYPSPLCDCQQITFAKDRISTAEDLVDDRWTRYYVHPMFSCRPADTLHLIVFRDIGPHVGVEQDPAPVLLHIQHDRSVFGPNTWQLGTGIRNHASERSDPFRQTGWVTAPDLARPLRTALPLSMDHRHTATRVSQCSPGTRGDKSPAPDETGTSAELGHWVRGNGRWPIRLK